MCKEVRCLLLEIDRISYSNALDIQHDLHARCASGDIPGALILLEHDPVITMGVKTSSRGNVLASPKLLEANGIELVETDRGGDVTYHGPGQLVGYPIVRVREMGGDVHRYLRALEQSVIDTLAEFGLEGSRNGLAGVWVKEKKVCSIGIAVRKGVTYHGFALNVDPNLSHFGLINPCGLASEQITSMAKLLGEAPNMRDVRDAYARAFSKIFNVTLCEWCDSA
ncbi:MAG: lipoyl(octanoyl) transferase LipB [Armatimonadota bacterium]|nr:lipoyl(octanoyl) transferase LipB [bacterium]